MPIFAGIALILGSTGTFFSRLLLGGDGIARGILEELQREAEQTRESKLDELERNLEGDGDPRTEKSLRDLRTLMKVFSEKDHWSSEINAQSAYDILTRVTTLFEGSVSLLEKSLELKKAASHLEMDMVRESLLARREKIIEDVISSITGLGEILAGIQGLNAQSSSVELAGIRSELDATLEVAKKVEERMREFDEPNRNKKEFEK
jgi:hypothetical protein